MYRLQQELAKLGPDKLFLFLPPPSVSRSAPPLQHIPAAAAGSTSAEFSTQAASAKKKDRRRRRIEEAAPLPHLQHIIRKFYLKVGGMARGHVKNPADRSRGKGVETEEYGLCGARGQTSITSGEEAGGVRVVITHLTACTTHRQVSLTHRLMCPVHITASVRRSILTCSRTTRTRSTSTRSRSAGSRPSSTRCVM